MSVSVPACKFWPPPALNIHSYNIPAGGTILYLMRWSVNKVVAVVSCLLLGEMKQPS